MGREMVESKLELDIELEGRERKRETERVGSEWVWAGWCVVEGVGWDGAGWGGVMQVGGEG